MATLDLDDLNAITNIINTKFSEFTNYKNTTRVLPIVDFGTQADGYYNASTFFLRGQEDPTNPRYIPDFSGCVVRLTGGTGVGQARLIRNNAIDFGFFGSILYLESDWDIIPDETTTYEILLTELSHGYGASIVALRVFEISLDNFSIDSPDSPRTHDVTNFGSLIRKSFQDIKFSSSFSGSNLIGVNALGAGVAPNITVLSGDMEESIIEISGISVLDGYKMLFGRYSTATGFIPDVSWNESSNGVGDDYVLYIADKAENSVNGYARSGFVKLQFEWERLGIFEIILTPTNACNFFIAGTGAPTWWGGGQQAGHLLDVSYNNPPSTTSQLK